MSRIVRVPEDEGGPARVAGYFSDLHVAEVHLSLRPYPSGHGGISHSSTFASLRAVWKAFSAAFTTFAPVFTIPRATISNSH